MAPRSSFSLNAGIIPESSYSKKRPWDVGKTRIGCPACPNTSDSMSRPNSWLYCLLYSRFMRARIVTEPPDLRHLPVFPGVSGWVCQFLRSERKKGKIKFRDARHQSSPGELVDRRFPSRVDFKK